LKIAHYKYRIGRQNIGVKKLNGIVAQKINSHSKSGGGKQEG